MKTFTLAVDQINKLKPDFVVICGDLVNKANEKSWADFNRIKSGFKIPCHCAAGNHDVENQPTAESLKLYREKIGKDYYAVDHTPSYLWDSASRSISAALIVHLSTVLGGRDIWSQNETIRRAINIEEGVVKKSSVLSFQNRQPNYPHACN